MGNKVNHIEAINTVHSFHTQRGKINSKNKVKSSKKQLTELTRKS